MENKLFYPITIVLIIVFLYFLLGYAISNTDVDDAITSAVQAFIEGTNPYQEDVVEHHTSSGVVYGHYHYFPPDLIIYSLFYLLIGDFFFSILQTYWFVPLHLFLLIPGYWLVTQIINWPHQKLFPFFLLLVTPFLFTNSMLMWFFFLTGYYLYEQEGYETLGMSFYVLAASIKYMVGFIIIFYFLRTIHELKQEKELLRNWRIIRNKLTPYIISSLILALISFPFGLVDVIIAVFIYQGDPQSRGDVAQMIGPLLIEILKILNLISLYIPIAASIIILTLILLRNKTTYEKIVHFSFLSMIVLPFYATELFITLPFYWWFKEGEKSLNLQNSISLKEELISYPP